MTIGVVYCFYFDTPDNGVYVGQTRREIDVRIKEHFYRANNKTEKGNWVKLNSKSDFKYEILYNGDELDFYEKKYIREYKEKYNKVYNIIDGNGGLGSFGFKHSEQEKRARSMWAWNRDYKIYKFYNKNGDKFIGDRFGFSKYSNLKPQVICQLINKTKKVRNGWYYGIDTDIRGNKKPKNKTVFSFIHKDYGVENCTCYELREKYNLDDSKVYQVVNGNRLSVKGWSLNKSITQSI